MLYKNNKIPPAIVFNVWQDNNMEQENFLTGGVALLHSVVDGKHCYEVGKVLTTKPSDFGSKGDKLMMINDVETQHLPPKKFVRMLSSGSPLLTMHRASIDEGENTGLETESMRPYYKETTVLYFTLDMVQEISLDHEEENPPVPEESECESSDMKDDNFTDEEILLVSMTNTCVAVVQARCCDDQSPCNSCGGTGCALSDFVMATKQSKITSGYRECILKNFERGHVLIQSLLHKSISPENVPSPRRQLPHMSNSTSANVTIYYYMAKVDEKLGVPVVLNFSGSTNFLKCMCEKDMPVLTVECCEKSKLQRIYKDDKATWPFVFYLTTTKDNIRRFESAAYSGWFIHTKPSGMVCVDQGSNNSESNFYVVIYLGKE